MRLMLIIGLMGLALPALALPALAQNVTPPAGLDPAPAAPDAAPAPPSVVCAAVANSNSSTSTSVSTPPGVPSADYQPGVDVNGNAVAPADLPSSAPSPAINNFPIEIDKHLSSAFKLPPGVHGKAILGYVTLQGNQPYFNGQPLNADQRAAVASACNGTSNSAPY